MKSLSISTATFAVAISLASSANANEAHSFVTPETNELVKQEALSEPAAPVPAIGDDNALVIAEVAPQALINEAFSLKAAEGLLTLPEPNAAQPGIAGLDARVVTTSSIAPNYGDINAFWGDIVAFYGDINAFWGDISPFYGDIDAFWGNISPFYGDISAFWGDIDAFYGDISAFDAEHLNSLGDFWNTSGAQITNVESLFNSISYYSNGSIVRDGTPNKVMAALGELIVSGEARFGAAYTAKTGKPFSVLVDEIFARHGANPSNKATIEVLTAGQRAALYLDWHDSLNQFSGIDHVDHWMGTINWTPSVTHIQGAGRQTIIGVVDGSFASDADLADNVVWSGGGTTAVGGHGAGVASLIAGAHDGKGVMGIAPEVKIATYNPFGADSRSSWDSVGKGVESLFYKYIGGNKTGYVSIINLSLGESGWTLSQGMADVLARPKIARFHDETLYVIAAGNDGVSQTADIDWTGARDANIIVVGSVDPNGQISSFSNRPGDACLLVYGTCKAGNELYKRTIVAPGSLILASDGAGGVTRVSGTSFAAPLVSGAVSLLHDRWPWLVRHQSESAEIIFRSARDLGAPGPDAVYGHGLLDVAASQSPLDFNAMQIYLHAPNQAKQALSATQLFGAGVPGWWETEGVYFTAFEKVGGTFRDFAIPMSSFTSGSSTNALGNGYQRMQDFVTDRFANWLLSKGADTDGDGQLGVTQVRSNTTETSGQWTMRYDAIQPRFTQDGAVRPVHNATTLISAQGNMSFTVGHGQGALALAGNSFGIISDHDHETGGVNPVLGFASGGVFAGASYKPAKATTLSVGYSGNREDWEDLDGVSDLDRSIQRELGARQAEAITFGIDQKITNNVSVNAQWTQLREKDALLGAQTSIDALLGEGSKTDAVTVTATVDFGGGLSFDLSATGGATQTANGQLLASQGQVMSSAGQFSVNKRGVMGKRDILRVSVGQPLTIEQGELELRSEQVVDRLTGERGIVTQTIGIETKRRYTGEIVYATPVTKASELGIVGRYISAGEQGQDESFIIGANFGLRF